MLGSIRLKYASIPAKVFALCLLLSVILAIHVYNSESDSNFLLSLKSFLPTGNSRTRSSCSTAAYTSGSWMNRSHSSLTKMSKPADALEMAGLEACASSREFYWHLAADSEEQWDRFPGVMSYDWVPGNGCSMYPFNAEEMVRGLVENGGWLLIGDSVTEGHFFSLSCLLYPHVRATPNYTDNPYFERHWPQHLYLSPSSPLLSSLQLPPSFNITSTPLVTFRRVDLLLDQHELESLYRLHHPEIIDKERSGEWSLFSKEKFWSMSPREYMGLFLGESGADFSGAVLNTNYASMIISTGGHWTTTLMHGMRDDKQSEEQGYGIKKVIDFFGVAMDDWAGTVQGMLDAQGGGKQVVVRAYLPGHEDCHDFKEPWVYDHGFRWHHFNWPWIQELNNRFQKVLSKKGYPDIHYLPIERPARLRPDAHATGDCLHIMAGAGVLEGWTHYIWHFLEREVQARIR